MGPYDIDQHGAHGEGASCCCAAPDDSCQDEQGRRGECKAGKNGDRKKEPDRIRAAPFEDEGDGVEIQEEEGEVNIERSTLNIEVKTDLPLSREGREEALNVIC